MARVTPDFQHLPIRLGMGFVFLAVAALISNPAAGYIIEDQHGQFKGLQIFAGSAIMLGGAVFLLMRFMFVGFGWRAKA